MDRDNHIMIDLETLDTNPTGVILSIGSCLFNPENGQITEKFYNVCEIQPQLDKGRTISESTMIWWMDQNYDARSAIFEKGLTKEFLMKSLVDLRDFIPQEAYVWSNGSTFDIILLEHAYRQHSLNIPWKFWNTRDVRTIVHLADHLVSKHDIPFEGTKHNALADAIHQAKYVSAMWQALKSE